MAILNLEHLEMLKSVLEAERFSVLLDLYINDSAGLLTNCQQALNQENWAQLKESAHALKGSSANVGVPDVAALAQSLEETAPTQDKSACLILVTSLTAHHKMAIDALQEFNGS